MAILDTSARRRFQTPTTRGVTSADLFNLNKSFNISGPPGRNTPSGTSTARSIQPFGGFLGEDPGANFNPGPRPQPAVRTFNAPIPFTRPEALPEIPRTPPPKPPPKTPPAGVPGGTPGGAGQSLTPDIIAELFGQDPSKALLSFLSDSGLSVGDQRFLRGRSRDILEQFKQAQSVPLAGGGLPTLTARDFFSNFNFQNELGRFSPASRGFGAPTRTRFQFG